MEHPDPQRSTDALPKESSAASKTSIPNARLSLIRSGCRRHTNSSQAKRAGEYILHCPSLAPGNIQQRFDPSDHTGKPISSGIGRLHGATQRSPADETDKSNEMLTLKMRIIFNAADQPPAALLDGLYNTQNPRGTS
jgi:hypothetical protein